MYKFLGQLMGMAIRTGVVLTVELAPYFWKQLVGDKLTIADLNDIDHPTYGFFQFLKHECTQPDLEGPERTIYEKFTITLSDKSVVTLKKDGENIDVTYENREEFINLAIKARLEESRLQANAIRKGIFDVVPPNLFNLLTWQDLQWRVCGKTTIDIQLLRRHTEYSSVQKNDPHIIYFWDVLESFTQEERRAFLRFSWAQERLPANDQEFIRTRTRFLIKPFTGITNHDQAFPKADTCFFNLMLPEYSSPEILRERLLYAIFTDSDSMNADVNEDQRSRGLF